MVHIKLSTIKHQLQQKMHYPEEVDPQGEYLCLDEAFDELLRGFGKWLMRNGKGGEAVVWKAKRDSFFSEKFADLFTDYCIKGWKVV